MSNAVMVAEQKQDRAVASSIRTIDAAYGPVAIINDDLLTPKTVGIMMAALEDPLFESAGHGLFSIVIRDDGRPFGEIVHYEGDDEPTYEPSIWRIYPDPKVAVCNLVECVQSAIRDTQSGAKPKTECVSVYAATWKNILQGFFHEAHHANRFLTDANLLSVLENRLAEDVDGESIKEEAETAACAFAREILFKLAKKMDIEVEFSAKVATMVDTMLMAEIEAINGDADSPDELKRWATIQTYLRDNGGVYYDPKIPGTDTHTICLKSFKSFLHFLSRDADNDPSWNTKTDGIVNVGMVAAPLNEDAHGNSTLPGAQVMNTLFPAAVEGVSYDDDDYTPDYEYNGPTTVPGFEGVANFVAPAPVVVAPAPVTPTGGMPASNGWTAPWDKPAAPAVTPNPGVVNPTYGYNPNVVVGANAYQPVVLPAGVNAMDVVYGLYKKIFMHIFRDCRYNPRNLAMPFEMAGNIATPLPLDQHEILFAKEMTCLVNGQRRTVPVQGSITGLFIDKECRLPGYDLILSLVDGTQVKRRFIPQNPTKVNKDTKVLSAPALEAQNGAGILWIMDPDNEKGFSVRVYNGMVQKSVGRDWVNAQ